MRESIRCTAVYRAAGLRTVEPNTVNAFGRIRRQFMCCQQPNFLEYSTAMDCTADLMNINEPVNGTHTFNLRESL